MTSLAHHAPRFGLSPQPSGAARELVVVRAGAHRRVALVALVVVACLLSGAILTAAAIAGIDPHGRVPRPVPLPSPTGRSLAGS